MAKRFIDTGLFDDEWFMELSKEGKITWLYFITKCDHAGIVKLNRKLFEIQSGVKNIDTVIKELGNRLVTVSQELFFIPKFITFQYPNFPQSTVKQQDSAVKILEKYGLFKDGFIQLPNSSLTLSQDLGKSYDNDNDNVIVNEVKEETLLQKAIKTKYPNVSKLKTQLTFEESERLTKEFKAEDIKSVLLAMENHKDLLKKYNSVNLTMRNWLRREVKNTETTTISAPKINP